MDTSYCLQDVLGKYETLNFWQTKVVETCYSNGFCMYLRQFLGTSFGTATLPTCINTDQGRGTRVTSTKWTIPKTFQKFLDTFPRTDNLEFQELGVNNLCEILSQNLRKLGE